MGCCLPEVNVAYFDCQDFLIGCGTKKTQALTVNAGTVLECGQVVEFDPATMTVVDTAPGALAANADHYAVYTGCSHTFAANDSLDFWIWVHDVNLAALSFQPLTPEQLTESLANAGGKICARMLSAGGSTREV